MDKVYLKTGIRLQCFRLVRHRFCNTAKLRCENRRYRTADRTERADIFETEKDMELVQQYSGIFHIILVILALLTICCLIRAVMGPTIADRLVAVNMMGTIVMVIIAVLGLLMDEDYLVDICLIYAMISFLAVVVLTKVYTGVYKEHRERLEKKCREEEKEE